MFMKNVDVRSPSLLPSVELNLPPNEPATGCGGSVTVRHGIASPPPQGGAQWWFSVPLLPGDPAPEHEVHRPAQA
jgi:hypothetical protein